MRKHPASEGCYCCLHWQEEKNEREKDIRKRAPDLAKGGRGPS